MGTWMCCAVLCCAVSLSVGRPAPCLSSAPCTLQARSLVRRLARLRAASHAACVSGTVHAIFSSAYHRGLLRRRPAVEIEFERRCIKRGPAVDPRQLSRRPTSDPGEWISKLHQRVTLTAASHLRAPIPTANIAIAIPWTMSSSSGRRCHIFRGYNISAVASQPLVCMCVYLATAAKYNRHPSPDLSDSSRR